MTDAKADLLEIGDAGPFTFAWNTTGKMWSVSATERALSAVRFGVKTKAPGVRLFGNDPGNVKKAKQLVKTYREAASALAQRELPVLHGISLEVMEDGFLCIDSDILQLYREFANVRGVRDPDNRYPKQRCYVTPMQANGVIESLRKAESDVLRVVEIQAPEMEDCIFTSSKDGKWRMDGRLVAIGPGKQPFEGSRIRFQTFRHGDLLAIFNELKKRLEEINDFERDSRYSGFASMADVEIERLGAIGFNAEKISLSRDRTWVLWVVEYYLADPDYFFANGWRWSKSNRAWICNLSRFESSEEAASVLSIPYHYTLESYRTQRSLRELQTGLSIYEIGGNSLSHYQMGPAVWSAELRSLQSARADGVAYEPVTDRMRQALADGVAPTLFADAYCAGQERLQNAVEDSADLTVLDDGSPLDHELSGLKRIWKRFFSA